MGKKLSEADIDRVIVSSAMHRMTERTTVCVLTLANGFEVLGQSACADAASYNQKEGEHWAYQSARGKIWELEGYRLREALYAADHVPGAYGQDMVVAEDTQRLQDVPVMMHALAAAIEQGHNTGVRALVVTHSGSVNAPVSVYGFGENVTPNARGMLQEAVDWFRDQERLHAGG